MQQIALNCFQVDLDIIPHHALSDLKKFYIERLGMNYNDVYLHLPQLKNPHLHPRPRQRPISAIIRNALQGDRDVPSKGSEDNIQRAHSKPVK